MNRFAVLLVLATFSAQAGAWGRDGHRIVAHLAQAQLRPTALAETRRLLAGEPEPGLAGVANWADDLRASDPEGKTARWHYVNFKGGDCSYAPARDCPDGNCVVGAINRQLLVLADRHRPDAERRAALKFLVHFIADVHQPLHASPRDDKGGNDYQVSYRGRGGNLHGVWDRDIVASRRLPPDAYASLLARQSPLPPDGTRRSDRQAVDWAIESCRLVAEGNLYPPRRVVDDAWLLQQRPIAEARLRQAGARIADMLNVALTR